MSTIKLDLEKRRDIVLNLAKNKGIQNQKAAIKLVLDYSGSMDGLYRDGSVQKLIERVLPVAMVFDDDQQVEVYLFSNGYKKISNTISVSNIDGWIKKNVDWRMGSTEYSPVINAITKEYTGGEKKGGFLGGIFGGSKKNESENTTKDPAYVLFITDGNCDDTGETVRAITDASKHGIFWQFIGIGRATFPFLERLDTMSGRELDNANFFKAADIIGLSDDELYGKLLAEFPDWLPQARSKRMIK